MQERSFSGKAQRPTPEIHFAEDGSFGAIVTPWGSRSSVKRVTDMLTDFISSAKSDLETTSPFQTLTCLSPMGNTLRAAVMLTNDILYREENKNDYQSGVELLVFARSATEISFVQIGQPNIFLSRKGQPITALGLNSDLSLEWSRSNKQLPPLPNDLLGVHSTSNFRVVSFRPSPGDKLIFVNHSYLPPAFYQTPEEQRNLDQLSQLLAKERPDCPFWLGVYELPTWKATANENEDAA
jgi:hypothetical protein